MAELLDRLARVAHGAQFCAGLNPAQWQALRYLARANRYSRSPGAIAEYLGATPGTISQTLIALESKGYIRRSRAAGDRRSVDVALTLEGEALLAHDPLTVLGGAIEELSGEERTALTTALDRVLGRVQAARGRSGFGLCRDCTHLQPGEAPDGGCQAQCRCGITGDALAGRELHQICVEFSR
jgi:DNA-binding MarR family transcriptional regulator